ncbi:MAG: asparagine synthase (glutamine-hydrolyzing) [Acidobacteriaceae bacterium]|nr:asparagine synthase (glutamine-hydrolyzing) [Acidobacteriaceae bacterium]
MCGIAGIVGFEPKRTPHREISGMLAALARRGPDDEGRHAWDSAFLAHRRLAIIDLSPAGHQPMVSEDGEIGLVFNGCIYNFAELRRELERDGQVFRSNCDTEVILRGYAVWGGERMVRRLRGMFAFAIWDDRSRKLFIARDRLGVKPLCYATAGNRIAFASTPAALHAAGYGGDVSPEAVLEFLEFGFVTEEHCIYEGIRKVPPATFVEWEDGKLKSTVYWQDRLPEKNGISFEEAVAQAESELLEAVQLRLFADVPVSALLSGGIDSTLVCWALAKLGANVRAFTVSLPGEPEDEAVHAGVTAGKIGIPHEKITVPDMGDDAVDLVVSAFSEPFSAYSSLAMLRLSEAIKPYATVMITGDGGDEAFLGYPVHRHAFMAQTLANRLPAGAPVLWKMLRPAVNGIGALRRPKHFLDYATGGLGAITQVHDGLPYYTSQNLLGPRLEVGGVRHRGIPASMNSARNLLPELLEYNRNTEFVGEFLTKVDGSTMYYAMEARSPFLDHKLWEFASSIDFDVRLKDGRLKSILRELVSRRVGPEVAFRPKQGFHLPIDKWLVTRWKSKVYELMEDSPVSREGWIRRELIADVAKRALADGRANIHIWRLVLLNTWLSRQGALNNPDSDVEAPSCADVPAI